MPKHDSLKRIIVIGGGIVGLGTALKLIGRGTPSDATTPDLGLVHFTLTSYL